MNMFKASLRPMCILSTLVLAAACATTAGLTKEAEEDPPVDGKGDSIARLREHRTALQEIGEANAAITEAERAHAWTFRLAFRETVTIQTALPAGAPSATNDHDVDTVLYLYRKGEDGWGRYIQKNDDISPEWIWSRIYAELEPGDYRVIVKGHDRDARGEFAISLACADDVCEATDDTGAGPTDRGTGTADRAGTRPVSFRMRVVGFDGVPLSNYNDELAAAGQPTFPEYLTISSTAANPTAEFDALVEVTNEDEVQAIIPTDFLHYGNPSDVVECYTGDGSALAEFFTNFGDGIFSDMLRIYGWRSGSRSAYEEWREPTSQSIVYEEWQEYEARGRGVLVVYSDTDSGEEVVTTVPRCAP